MMKSSSIERIEVIYDQHLEGDMPDPSDQDDPVIIDDTHEELILDRQSETIEIHRKFSYGKR